MMIIVESMSNGSLDSFLRVSFFMFVYVTKMGIQTCLYIPLLLLSRFVLIILNSLLLCTGLGQLYLCLLQ